MSAYQTIDGVSALQVDVEILRVTLRQGAPKAASASPSSSANGRTVTAGGGDVGIGRAAASSTDMAILHSSAWVRLLSSGVRASSTSRAPTSSAAT